MARALAERGVEAVFSYAGVTRAPIRQPLPTRVGGFGGVAGLAEYLRREAITHVIDATHPFAAGMSANAIAACAETGVALTALERAPWPLEDSWRAVPDMAAAVAAVPEAGARVFLAIGKQSVDDFAPKPGNFYLLRMIDPPDVAPALPHCHILTGRGPFSEEEERSLLTLHKITHVVAKNGGAPSARRKLDAAGALGLEVIVIARPAIGARHICRTADEALGWLGHSADLGV